jgi:UDP-N-acetylmuramoyl-L-alanyl-D-glutamate--2,6-diaminopimelate ligase
MTCVHDKGMPLKIRELFQNMPEFDARVAATGDFEISELHVDARKVTSRSVFVAVKGTKHDAHDFIPQAVSAGAYVLVVEETSKVPADFKGLVFQTLNSRETLDKLAANFYRNASMEMFCYGVTGTNGKTSVTYMLEFVLDRLRLACGVLGTINHHLGNKVWPTEVTTPGPIELQCRLREMKDEGAKAIAMEVSSHALAQHRADGVHFNTVIFTNVSRDHLDYHKNETEYFLAKQRLFTDLLWNSKKPIQFAVINIDDKCGARLRLASHAGLWTYGKKESADFSFQVNQVGFSKTEYKLKTPYGEFESSIPMCGEHNMYNAVAVIAATASAGLSVAKVVNALTEFPGVPGRLQAVSNSRALNVFVDYAHSPDALENVLKSLHRVREQMKAKSKIWTVFGCGGDRDKGKRPLMAQVACRWSDEIMLTSDNPRTEVPEQIISDIFAGVEANDRARVQKQVDRKKAIEEVLRQAQMGDVVLIAGKGHEDYQIVGQEKLPFSDYSVAKELLK